MIPIKRTGLAFRSSISTSRQQRDAGCTRAPTALAIECRIAEVGDAERIAALIRELATKFILCDFSAEGKSRFLCDHTSMAVVDRIRTRFRYRIAEFDGELVAVIGVRECLERGNPGTFTVNSAQMAVPVYERFGFVATGLVQDVGGVRFVRMKLDVLHTMDER